MELKQLTGRSGLWAIKRWKELAVILVALAVILGIGLWYRSLGVVIRQGDYGPFASKQDYDQFYAVHPLLTAQPPKDAPFTLSTEVTDQKLPVYTFTLLSITPHTNAESFNRYIASLKNYQQQALRWVKSQGQNPSDLHIVWVPDPSSFSQPTLDYSAPPLPQRQKSSALPTATAAAVPTASGSARFPQ